MKKVPEKYTYIWTILSGIPFGIGMLIGAYTSYNSISNNTNELVSNSGQILEYGKKDVYHKGIDATISVYEIKLNTGIYWADIGKRIKLLEEFIPDAFETQKNITIWTEKNSLLIEQLAINDKIVLPYKPSYWQALTFFIIGIVFTGMGTIYLINYFKSTWFKP